MIELKNNKFSEGQQQPQNQEQNKEQEQSLRQQKKAFLDEYFRDTPERLAYPQQQNTLDRVKELALLPKSKMNDNSREELSRLRQRLISDNRGMIYDIAKKNFINLVIHPGFRCQYLQGASGADKSYLEKSTYPAETVEDITYPEYNPNKVPFSNEDKESYCEFKTSPLTELSLDNLRVAVMAMEDTLMKQINRYPNLSEGENFLHRLRGTVSRIGWDAIKSNKRGEKFGQEAEITFKRIQGRLDESGKSDEPEKVLIDVEEMEQKENINRKIIEILRNLTDRQKDLLARRFLYTKAKRPTFKDLESIYNISDTRVKQIQDQMITKITKAARLNDIELADVSRYLVDNSGMLRKEFLQEKEEVD